jgi:hypothetical protein
LNLAGTKITDAGVPQLERLPSLCAANLAGTSTSDAAKERLGKLLKERAAAD